jgi:hypothetical protein
LRNSIHVTLSLVTIASDFPIAIFRKPECVTRRKAAEKAAAFIELNDAKRLAVKPALHSSRPLSLLKKCRNLT